MVIGFIFHDKTNPSQIESEIRLEDFPTPEQLWQKYCFWKGYTEQQLPVITQDYYDDGSGKSPRYSLKEGIEDGFLAPYKVVRVDLDVDLQGWRPTKGGQTDKHGEQIEDRIDNQKDFDRTLVIDERTGLVAQTITNYLKRTDPMAKTIVFCNDIDHAERMRRALVNLNPEQVAKNEKYVMKITGDDEAGKAQLDNFINPKKPYPVIANTSELMTTGVDAKTCKTGGAGSEHPVHDQVQADHRSWHPY